jgi:hypothetical protein
MATSDRDPQPVQLPVTERPARPNNLHDPGDVPATRSTASHTGTPNPPSRRVTEPIGRNGNPRGHPDAVQEADPQLRVRAVESE